MWTGTLDSNVREHMLSTTLELGAVPNRNRSNNEQPRLDTDGPVLIVVMRVVSGFFSFSTDILDMTLRGDPSGISKIARYCYVSCLPDFFLLLPTPSGTLSPPLSTMLGWGGIFFNDLLQSITIPLKVLINIIYVERKNKVL
jgi:hypothetical protein